MKQRGAVLSVLMTVAACASPASSPLGPVASLAPAPSTPLPLPALIEPSPSLEPAGGTPIAAQSLSGTIVYSTGSDKNDDVFLLRLDGSEPVRLTDAPEKEFDPDLSANGAQIAYRRNPRADSDEADIWVMNVDGTDKRNLTNGAQFSNWAPSWTPDGRIAYSSMRGSGGALELWTMKPDGTDARRVSEGWCEYAEPSPDGSAFVCASNVGGRYDILVIDARTGERRALTTTPMTEFGPTWSPDGQWIVFSRDLGNRWALMRIRPDGSGERLVAEEGVFATWDPAGHLVWIGPGGINIANPDGSGRVALDYPAEFISWGK